MVNEHLDTITTARLMELLKTVPDDAEILVHYMDDPEHLEPIADVRLEKSLMDGDGSRLTLVLGDSLAAMRTPRHDEEGGRHRGGRFSEGY